MKSTPLFATFLVLFSVTTAFAQFSPQSTYTSLKHEDCITVNSQEFLPANEQGMDFYTGVCPGFGGYTIMVAGGDLRYSLMLSFNNRNITLPYLDQFHDTALLAEWRYTLSKNKDGFSNNLNLNALIYRLYYSNFEETGKYTNKSLLVVVRLNREQSCVIGLIPEQVSMNDLARKLADDLTAKCIKL